MQIPICENEHNHQDIIIQTKKDMPSENSLTELSNFFKILGDKTRVKILSALDKSEMCVCDLASLLQMTKSAISHQLFSLKQSNLVKYRKSGKNVFYSLADEHVKVIFECALEHILEEKNKR